MKIETKGDTGFSTLKVLCGHCFNTGLPSICDCPTVICVFETFLYLSSIIIDNKGELNGFSSLNEGLMMMIFHFCPEWLGILSVIFRFVY